MCLAEQMRVGTILVFKLYVAKFFKAEGALINAEADEGWNSNCF
jgi:hypothetical protein